MPYFEVLLLGKSLTKKSGLSIWFIVLIKVFSDLNIPIETAQ